MAERQSSMEESINALSLHEIALRAPETPFDPEGEVEQLAATQESSEKITESLMTITEGMDDDDRAELIEGLEYVDGIDNENYLVNLAKLKRELGIRVDQEFVEIFPPEIGADTAHVDAIIKVVKGGIERGAEVRDLEYAIPRFKRKYIKQAIIDKSDWVIGNFELRGVISPSIIEAYDEKLKAEGYKIVEEGAA